MRNLKSVLASILQMVEKVEENPAPENIMVLKASVTTLYTVCPDEEKESPLTQIVTDTILPMLGNIIASVGADLEDIEVKTSDGKTVPFPGTEA